MKPQCVTIQMKAIEQDFHMVLFIMLYNVVLIFKSVDENLLYDHSNESYWAVLAFKSPFRYFKINDSFDLFSLFRVIIQ